MDNLITRKNEVALLLMSSAVAEETLNRIERLIQGKAERKKLLKTKEVCELLECTDRTLLNYAKAGYLHPIHWSASKVRYDYEEVINFMNGGQTA